MLRLHEAVASSAFSLAGSVVSRLVCLALPSTRIASLRADAFGERDLLEMLQREIGVHTQGSRFCVDILGSDDLERGELQVSEYEASFLEWYLGDPDVLFVRLRPKPGAPYVRVLPMPDAADAAYWRGAIQLLATYGPGLTIATPVGFDLDGGDQRLDGRYDALEALNGYARGLGLVSADGRHNWDPVSGFGYRFLEGMIHPGMPLEYKSLYRALFQIHAWGEVLSHASDAFFQENPFGLLFDDPEEITSMLVDDLDRGREGEFFVACVYPERLVTVLRALAMQEYLMEQLWRSRFPTHSAGS